MFDSESDSINRVLRQVEEAADSAKTEEELIEAVDIACQYPGSLYPNNTIPIILIICGVLIAVIALFGADGKPSDKAIMVIMLALAVSFTGFAMTLRDSSRPVDISYKIARLTSYFSNNLKVFHGTSSSDLLELRKNLKTSTKESKAVSASHWQGSIAGKYMNSITSFTDWNTTRAH